MSPTDALCTVECSFLNLWTGCLHWTCCDKSELKVDFAYSCVPCSEMFVMNSVDGLLFLELDEVDLCESLAIEDAGRENFDRREDVTVWSTYVVDPFLCQCRSLDRQNMLHSWLKYAPCCRRPREDHVQHQVLPLPASGSDTERHNGAAIKSSLGKDGIAVQFNFQIKIETHSAAGNPNQGRFK